MSCTLEKGIKGKNIVENKIKIKTNKAIKILYNKKHNEAYGEDRR